MEKTQTLEEFYKSKFKWVPAELKEGLGHFNVFELDPFVGKNAKPLPYNRKDFYKITLFIGNNRIHYADKTVDCLKYSLLFGNPMIPYSWEPLDDNQSGFFCIFTEDFFSHFGNIKEYPVFKPGGDKVFTLNETTVQEVTGIFKQMLAEIKSDYQFKYDVLRNLVYELVHKAQKMQPAALAAERETRGNAAMRTTAIFVELLERQFPIESINQQIKLKTPAEFAGQLAVHVNHLNRNVKTIMGKTTSQVIAERMAQEARALLKHTNWNISEISWCLGFEELAHFIHFFKRFNNTTPKEFRR
ncbi:transcriptional regulator [Niastella koreensis]|uniref:Transcriptional regulator, AraC family n=2 Tax=Niastella koreensis TaxID=354356 RepID=G8T9B9_NIAKG|nr:AraC family transcriptional regulator [Niastella koreensis]AEV98087.1 transcriptional regulator, AraC family [Niastella koreensis GR20-10]OQP40115.1 transcriptional regulator [Niastella koreensis]